MKKKSNIISTIKKHRSEIIVGLVTCAMWSAVLWIIKSAPKTGRTIFGTIQNLIYSCAAFTTATSIIIFIAYLVIGFFIAFAISPIMIEHIHNKTQKKYDEINEKLDQIEKEANIEKKMEQLKEIEEKDMPQGGKLSSRILAAFGILYCLFIILTAMIPAQISKTFDRDIKMIKPYTDNQTIWMLESDWTRMKSKTDYDKIYETINQIKEENNLPQK